MKIQTMVLCVLCDELYEQMTSHTCTPTASEAVADPVTPHNTIMKQHNVQESAKAGAKSDVEDFDLTQIPFEAERRIGKIFRERERKYGKDNWRKGSTDVSDQLERANHALKHIKLYVHKLQFGEDLGKPDEDALAQVAWFCATQMELERLNDGP